MSPSFVLLQSLPWICLSYQGDFVQTEYWGVLVVHHKERLLSHLAVTLQVGCPGGCPWIVLVGSIHAKAP